MCLRREGREGERERERERAAVWRAGTEQYLPQFGHVVLRGGRAWRDLAQGPAQCTQCYCAPSPSVCMLLSLSLSLSLSVVVSVASVGLPPSACFKIFLSLFFSLCLLGLSLSLSLHCLSRPVPSKNFIWHRHPSTRAPYSRKKNSEGSEAGAIKRP